MYRIVLVVAVILLWSLPVLAETYTWTDKSGTVNFSDDYYSVPKQYRKKVHKLGDMGAAPAPAATGKGGEQPSLPSAAPAMGQPVAGSADSGNGLYGGKKGKIWQQEFKARETEFRQLEDRLVQLEGLAKNPVDISRERMQGLPQEFKETQKRYNGALKAYNDLNDAANKAGLPAEFRK